MATRARANGEASIYRYRNGWAAYVWITTPEGRRQHKSVYGKTREEVHAKYLVLYDEASRGPAVTMDIYAQVSSESTRAALQALGGRLGEGA